MPDRIPRFEDIFVAGGFPRHTYNPRDELHLEARIAEVKNNLCKLVTVTGHTKSGKTVLTRTIFPQEEAIWIDGGTVEDEDTFWQHVVTSLNLFQEIEEEASSGAVGTTGLKGAIGANLGFGKIGGELSDSAGELSGEAVRGARRTSSQIVAIEGLRKSRTPLIIDDFHYISRDLQGNIVRSLKPLVFEGIPVVIIAIPHRRYDVVKVEREMAGRMSSINIPPWSVPDLIFIPTKGFELLNYVLEPAFVSRLAMESIGSPHLMQEFCRGLCKRISAVYNEQRRMLPSDQTVLESIFRETAETIGRPIYEKLARGPRARTDRKTRQLKDGREVDIYELVLYALARLRPGLTSLEYEELRSAIRDVSATAIPQLQEISRVLKHMATIAATDQSSTPVIDFEEAEKKLHITDPFFAFYLRWGDLSSS